jgi:DNA-binding NarL/FixJ family response regulator
MQVSPHIPLKSAASPIQASNGEVIRVALVEDETLIREGLLALIERTPGIQCVTSAADHVTAIRAAEFAPPDVALLDMTVPAAATSQGIALWTERLPQVRLLPYDDTVRDANIRTALRIGAAGYLTKRDRFVDWIEAVRKANGGEPAFTPAVRQRLRPTARGWELMPSDDAPGLHALTARETEVLTYLAQGLSGKQCSVMLGISPSTVDNHKSRIMRKLKVRKTVELTRLALREGLVPQ